MANTYTALHRHVIFSTKHRHKWVTPEIEDRVWAYLAGIARANRIQPEAIGGIDDHVHALLRLPATMAVSKAMQLLKGGSSVWIKETFAGMHGFGWQDGYAAFAVSKSGTAAVRDYIRGQREHHRAGGLQEELRTFLDRHEVEYDERYLWD